MDIHDLSVPECHYWHRQDFMYWRKRYIKTGSGLPVMLDLVRYASSKPNSSGGYIGWKPADNWNEKNLFRAPRRKRVIPWLIRNPVTAILTAAALAVIMTGLVS